MRLEAAWSMSTVGLTAQETSFPLENPFLWGSCYHSMDSKSSWGYLHPANPNFSIKSAYTDPKVNLYHRESPPLSPSYERHKPSPGTQKLLKKPRPAYLSLSCTPEPSTPSSSEDTHILSQPQSAHRGCSPPQTSSRCSKPLPPIPLQTDSCSLQSLENEENFTNWDDSCRLVADNQINKPVRFGHGRRSLRFHGQVNHAFSDHGPQSPRSTQTPQHHLENQHQGNYHQGNHHQGNHHQGNHLHTNHHQTPTPERHELQNAPTEQRAPWQGTEEIPVCPRQLQDKTQRRVRRTQSGPAGSFNKSSFLNLQSKRNMYSTYKSEVPPPIPPRLQKTEDPRRWSAEVSGAYSDEDKPPKLPPRDPMSRGCSRTPSPNSLPLYINGEMPPTQSFAPDPKYVYRGLVRQNSEGSPRIFPVMVNGQKDSNTHYFLLDEPSARDMDVSNSEWDYHSQKKTPVDFV
ncbi:ERBB receptor feedback inhibitor 1a [Eucyclogobius newberryi]|uniref:ERBB receptor feedback inhibitor 1a n=1 Tax=Eucyclogobius newberryi TaxID=166745 RepID=UPI003B5B21E1